MDMTTITTFYIFTMMIMFALTIIKVLGHSSVENKTQGKAYLIFTVWILADILFLGSRSIIPADISSLSLYLIIFFGVGVSGILLAPIMKALVGLPQHFLLLPHGIRMFFGLGFVIEAAYGVIPVEYGVLDGVLHITAAFLATTLAIYIAHGFRPRKSLILVNIFGLLDILIVATGIAFFALPEIGVEHNIFYVVFFAAPIFIWLHLISLYKCYTNSLDNK